MRVTANVIPDLNSLKQIVETCYKADEKLINTYHAIAPDTVENCISHTIKHFEDIGQLYKMTFYKIEVDGDFAAYFGYQPVNKRTEHLTGFFIMPKYRNDEFKLRFWRIVKSKFKNDIQCLFYSKNIRLARFLKKSGFNKLEHSVATYEEKPVEQWMF